MEHLAGSFIGLAASTGQNRPPDFQFAQRLSVIHSGREWGLRQMLHRTIQYDVQEVEPGLWRWNIYLGNRSGQGPAKFHSRELAVEACHGEINDGIDRTRRQAASR
jgi:hypothetical protein